MSKIYVNAGHGGSDSGAVGIGGRMEKDDNLRYAAAVADKLRVAGHDVNFERDGDYLIPVGEIARRANAWGADLFVSFHRNSFNGVAQGVECLVVSTASETSRIMAQEIQNRLVALGFVDRGIKEQDKRTQVLRDTHMPATTIECGFVDSAEDNALFDGRFDDIVQAITDGILAVAGGAQPAPVEPCVEFALTGVVSSNNGTKDEVRAVQRTLNDYGYGLSEDGIYGKKTKSAIVDFQSNHGLRADGIVGKNTCEAMNGRWEG